MRRPGVSAGLLVSIAACSSSRQNPTVLRDTVGAEFGWTCTQNGCEVHALPTSPELPADCAEGSRWGWTDGRFFSVCYWDANGTVGWTPVGVSCRPVVCEHDDDCPWAQFRDPISLEDITFACKGGVCQSDGVLGEAAVEELCLWNHARPATCHIDADGLPADLQQITHDAAESCPSASADGGACTVPPSCRQP